MLSLFGEDHQVISASEVARAFGMSRSTAYRYLHSLRASGLLEEVEAGGLRLGPRILELARIARLGWDIAAAARPVMQRVGAETGETVVLTRRAGDRVVCVEEVRSPHPVRISYERGRVLPLHAGASAKVVVAWLPAEELDSLLKGAALEGFTGSTVTSAGKLKRDLAVIRRQGYALSHGEVDAGVLGVAAPVLTAGGAVIAGLSVVVPEYRVGEELLERLVETVKQAAAELSEIAASAEG